MAIEFLSYSWKVLKSVFWNTDEDQFIENEISHSAKTKTSYQRILKETGDSKVDVGRTSKSHLILFREDQTVEFYDSSEEKNILRDIINNYEKWRKNLISKSSCKNYSSDENNFDSHLPDGDSYHSKQYQCLNRRFNYDEEYVYSKNEKYSYDKERGYEECYRPNKYDSSREKLYFRSYLSDSNEYTPQGVYFKDFMEKRLFKIDTHLNNGTHSRHSNLQHDDQFMHNLLFAFYELVNKHLCQKLSLSDHDIKLAMEKLIFNYKLLSRCETPETLNFNDMATCIGYLHRYAICHAALVYHTFIKLMSDSASFLRIFSRKELNTLFLGSGPGNDFIGFAFALLNSSIKVSNIDVTIVDKFSGWYTVFLDTIEMFNSLTDNAFVKASKTFLQADLSNYSTWNFSMRERLYCAHVVTLVKVLSNIPEKDHLLTLKNIVGFMKDGAFLIIIDCPLPLTELSALDRYLRPVYSSAREKFNFREKKTRFGYPNITQCTAYVRVYEKRNSHRYNF